MSTETYRFTWEGIEIELTYVPKAYGGAIAHLEVRTINPARGPLPITNTGYKSHYPPVGTVEAGEGTLVEQVTAWMDEEAKSKAWKKYVADSRQYSLF